jgi:hypothetical protein
VSDFHPKSLAGFVGIVPNVPDRNLAIGQPPVSDICLEVVAAFGAYIWRPTSDQARERLAQAFQAAHHMQDAYHDVFFLIRDDGQRQVIFTRIAVEKLYANRGARGAW